LLRIWCQYPYVIFFYS